MRLYCEAKRLPLCQLTPTSVLSNDNLKSHVSRNKGIIAPILAVQQNFREVARLFLAHNGLKCTVRQMAPPRYIFAVFPSKEGILISGAVAGYVAGISNSKSKSYFMSSCTYQHFPDQRVPSLFDVIVNQSESVPLLICMYLIRACSSCRHCQASSESMSLLYGNPNKMTYRQNKLLLSTSFKRFSHKSLSRGPAFVCTETGTLLC